MSTDRKLKKRLLVLTTTFQRWPGDNLPRFVDDLCEQLQTDFNVTVLAPHHPGSPLNETLRSGIDVQRFRYLPDRFETVAYGDGILGNLRHCPWRALALPFFLMGMFIAARRILKNHDFHAIHAHWLIPNALIALLARHSSGKRRLPLICTIHGSDFNGLNGIGFQQLRSMVLSRSAAVTCVGKHLLNDAATLTPAVTSRLHWLPMGIDMRERFQPHPEVPRNGLLCVTRMVPEKSVITLLQAMPAIAARFPGAILSIVGDGYLREPLERYCQDQGITQHVHFLGRLGNAALPDMYRSAKLLACPSLQEGLGLTLAEAMACGCPVIASDIPGHRDLVTDGVTGLLFSPGDAGQLAERISRILSDPALCETFARDARQTIEEKLGWHTIGPRYSALLDSLPITEATHARL